MKYYIFDNRLPAKYCVVLLAILLVGSIVAMMGCVLIDPEPLFTIATNPDRYNDVIPIGERLSITLTPNDSIEPSPITRSGLERIVSVRRGREAIGISMVWEGAMLIVEPVDPPIPGKRYVMRVFGTLSNDGGYIQSISLNIPFFFERRSFEPFRFFESSPASGQSIEGLDPIEIVFSDSVDYSSIDREITISPDIEYEIEANDEGNVVTIIPQERWEPFRRYRVSIGSAISNAEGESIAERERLVYWSGRAPELFAIRGVVAIPEETDLFRNFPSDDEIVDDAIADEGGGGWIISLSSRDSIAIGFSSDAETESVERNITIEPDIRGEYLWVTGKQAIFSPQSDWEIGRRYHLFLNGDMRSAAGVPLGKTTSVIIESNARHLSARSIAIANRDGGPIENPNSAKPLEITVGMDGDYSFTVIFDRPIHNGDQVAPALSFISLRRITRNGNGVPSRTSFSFIGDRSIRVNYTNITPSTEGRKNYLLLSITGGEDGIRALDGSFLMDDVEQLLVVEEIV